MMKPADIFLGCCAAASCVILALVLVSRGGEAVPAAPVSFDLFDEPMLLLPDSQEIQAALDKAPFRPDRVRPTVRFGEEIQDPQPPPQPALLVPEKPPFRLAGTMVAGTDRFAVLVRDGDVDRLVRQGDELDGLKVERIVRASVVLVSPDSTVILSLLPPKAHQ
jgi:hypothetical protein